MFWKHNQCKSVRKMMYQYFAKEQNQKPASAYGGYSHAVQIGKNVWTPFSGKWQTTRQAEIWSNGHGEFFRARGIELMLFCNPEDGGYYPARLNSNIRV